MFDLRSTLHVANWVMTSVVYLGTLGSLDWTAGSGQNDGHKVLYKALDYNVFVYGPFMLWLAVFTNTNTWPSLMLCVWHAAFTLSSWIRCSNLFLNWDLIEEQMSWTMKFLLTFEYIIVIARPFYLKSQAFSKLDIYHYLNNYELQNHSFFKLKMYICLI